MSTLKTMPQGRRWGARAIAEVLFGPEDAKSQWHKVYSLKHELPIFQHGVKPCRKSASRGHGGQSCQSDGRSSILASLTNAAVLLVVSAALPSRRSTV